MPIIKSIRKKTGIYAPRVAVRRHVPLHTRILSFIALILLIAGLSWGMYEAGSRLAGFNKQDVTEELGRLKELTASLQQENQALSMKTAGLESQSRIDQAMRDDFTKQVKMLGDENARLKEDVAFLQNFMSGVKANEPISINRFKLERGQSAGEYHYSLLLVLGKQRTRDFSGRVEFSVNLEKNGGKTAMLLPSENAPKESNINFKFYQRVENIFTVPPEVKVESLQVRIFENGVPQPRLTQTVGLTL